MFATSLPLLGGIGLPELIIIAVILLIMFGPGIVGAAIGIGLLVWHRRSGVAESSSGGASIGDRGMGVSESVDRQAVIDGEHLRLLPVCYWVLGAVTAFFALYGLFYLGMGLLLAFAPGLGSSEDGSVFVAGMFITMGIGFLLVGGTVATLQILTGFWIRGRKHRTACLVMAGISCMFVPFGTLFGVFTFMTLLRPSVSALFATTPGSLPSSSPGTVDCG